MQRSVALLIGSPLPVGLVHLLSWIVVFFGANSSEPCQSQEVATAESSTQASDFFESKVRPILVERCYECHSAEAKRLEGSLRLDHGSFLQTGGDSGAVVDTGNPAQSLLLQAIRFEGYEMPPAGKLPQREIDILTRWVLEGARWPDEEIPSPKKAEQPFHLQDRKAAHWAWQPIRRTPLPASNEIGGNNALDYWVQAKQKEASLRPAPTADRATRIRRLYWDLIGLPPSNDQLARWMEEPATDWYVQLVDHLLSDQQFGVRMARHWLDLTRYAQSRGHEFDEDIPGAEHYRDYLVRAFNSDLPYDQLLTEHVAGDLLASPRRHPTHRWNESVLGTGFWHLGEWIHSPVDTRKDETDRFDNMVDVFSKTFLGMTVACARCHDHKFDAISTEDYYAMYGYLKSSHYRLVRFETDEGDQQIAQELAHIRERFRQQLSDAFLDAFSGLPADQLLEFVTESNGKELNTARAFKLHRDDERVCFDPATLPSSMFYSDGQAFGTGIRPSGLAGAAIQPGLAKSAGNGNSPDANTNNMLHLSAPPFPTLAFDPFWARQKSLVSKVNSQNRNSQIDQAGKTFITPEFELRDASLSFLVRGNFRVFAAVDSHRLIAGPLHGETIFESRSSSLGEWKWVEGMNLRRYIGKRIHLELSPLDDVGFELAQIVQGHPPAKEPPSEAEPKSLETAAIEGRNVPIAAQERLVNGALQSTLPSALQAAVSEEKLSRVQRIVQEWQAAEGALASQVRWDSRVALAMRDGSGEDDHLLIRGNSDKPGRLVPRRPLEALDGNNHTVNEKTGSGRLQLAQHLLREENPLVARVIVNRLWHHLIGRGIAATTDDFGVQGKGASHPQLLDELAVSLRESDWSLKRVAREICLSHTYQQATAAGAYPTQDANNELWSFANVKKLPGESVRDGMLFVSGQMDLRLEGETPRVYLNDFMTGRGRPGKSGPMDGNGRRSVYLEVRRNFLNPMLTAFDMPTPFSSMGRRNVSNVPAQALTMLNDPLVHSLAERWADAIQRQNVSNRERIATMLRSTRGREPGEGEIDACMDFLLASLPQDRSLESSDPPIPTAAWKDLAHVLLNSKEMLFRF